MELYRSTGQSIEVVWGDESTVTLPKAAKPVPYGTSNDLIRILENAYNKKAEPLQTVTMNHWLTFSLTLEDEIPKSIDYLDKTLGPLTYLVGESLSVSDLAVFAVLHGMLLFTQHCKIISLNSAYIFTIHPIQESNQPEVFYLLLSACFIITLSVTATVMDFYKVGITVSFICDYIYL